MARYKCYAYIGQWSHLGPPAAVLTLPFPSGGGTAVGRRWDGGLTDIVGNGHLIIVSTVIVSTSASLSESVLLRYCTRLVFEKFNICRPNQPDSVFVHREPNRPGTHPPWDSPTLGCAALKICDAQIAYIVRKSSNAPFSPFHYSKYVCEQLITNTIIYIFTMQNQTACY